jgi:hypothetical protein
MSHHIEVHPRQDHQDDAHVHLLQQGGTNECRPILGCADYLDNYAQPSKNHPVHSAITSKPNHRRRNHHRRYANRLRPSDNSPNLLGRITHQLDNDIPIHQLEVPGKALATLDHIGTTIFIIKLTNTCLPKTYDAYRAGSDKSRPVLHCQRLLAYPELPRTNSMAYRLQYRLTDLDKIHTNLTSISLLLKRLQAH